MTKVCHISSVHQWSDVRIFRKQCCSLAGAGYEVAYVVSGDSFQCNGVDIVGLGEVPSSRIRRMLSHSRRAYEVALSLDCDIYELHDPELLPYAVKLKRAGKKVVFDSHEDYVAQIREKPYLPRAIARVASYVMKIYERWVFSCIDAVIFSSPSDSVEVSSDATEVVFLDNLPLQSEVNDCFSEDYRSRSRLACHVGSLTYARGIAHLVRAMEKVNGRLCLAGRFSPESFGEEVLSGHSEGKVEYAGFLDRPAVIDLYKRSSVGVCTLLNVGQYNVADNLPTKVYEYMAAGIPVVLSDGEHARTINDRYDFAILVDPEDEQGIASAINKLFDDQENACRMGLNGRKAVLERFNWGIEEKKLFDLYRRLANAS